MFAIVAMAGNVTHEHSHATDFAFGCFYLGSRFIDLLLLLRVYHTNSKDPALVNVANGFKVNASFVLLECFIAGMVLLLTDDGIIVWYAITHALNMVLFRPVVSVIWSKIARMDPTGVQVKFDFVHFRERQGLLVILVLGEAVVASTLSNTAENVVSCADYLKSGICVAIAYSIKYVYQDLPDRDAFTEKIGAVEGRVRGVTRPPGVIEKVQVSGRQANERRSPPTYPVNLLNAPHRSFVHTCV